MADENLRVALLTREYPPNVYGGAGVHVEYLARELARHIHVDVHRWGNPDDHAENSPKTNPRVLAHRPDPAVANAPASKFKAALEALSINLAEAADLGQANIIHTHTWYASLAGFLGKMLYRIPFILTTHSLEPLRAWKAEQLGTGYALSSWAESTAIHAADAIIAVSQGTRADILRAYPHVDPARIHVIYNGIDLDQYRRTADTSALRTYGVDPGKPYVLFVGRITRQKGVTHLVDAIQHLPPDTQVVLCAGAPDTPAIATEMREKVEQMRAFRRSQARQHHPDLKASAQTSSPSAILSEPGSPASSARGGGEAKDLHLSPATDRVPHVPRAWGHGINESQSGELTSPTTKSPSSRPTSSQSDEGAERPLYLQTEQSDTKPTSESRSDESTDHQNIIWIEKMVTKEETIQLYSHCRVFCCPSVYEPFGIINLEAMACEAPVVASATGGILEVVIDPGYQKSVASEHPESATQSSSSRPKSERSGDEAERPLHLSTNQPQSRKSTNPTTQSSSSRPESQRSADAAERPLYFRTNEPQSGEPAKQTDPQTGFLVPFEADPKTGFPTNPAQFAKDLASKLNDLLNNEQKAKQLGQNGRKRAETHFSWQTIAQQTIALYRKMRRSI